MKVICNVLLFTMLASSAAALDSFQAYLCASDVMPLCTNFQPETVDDIDRSSSLEARTLGVALNFGGSDALIDDCGYGARVYFDPQVWQAPSNDTYSGEDTIPQASSQADFWHCNPDAPYELPEGIDSNNTMLMPLAEFVRISLSLFGNPLDDFVPGFQWHTFSSVGNSST